MKFITLLVGIFSFNSCSFSLYAQDSEKKISNANVITAPASNKVFRYPQFLDGMVYFKNETRSDAKLNFNMLNGEMEFITPTGDTLAITNEPTIKFITIGKDSFYYDKGYIELLWSGTVARIAKKEILKPGDKKKAAGYGQNSSTSSIATYNSIITDGSQLTKMATREDLFLVKKTEYYIGDTYNHFLLANKKNLIKMFGKKQTAIENYLKENKVNFSSEEDLINIMGFLQKP